MRFHPKRALTLCLALSVVAILAQACFAQTFSSSIAGTITDPSGSVVQGAKIRLLNMSTHDTRETLSTAAGTYRFDNLLPGTYELTTEAAGFKPFAQSNMILRASTAATVNVALTVGGVEQQVQVTAEAVLLDTQSANNTATLDSRLIESLPNSYRNPLNFVFAVSGTTETQSGMTSRSNSFDQNGSMFGLNGGRSGNAQILIDGAPSTAVDWGGLLVAPNNDAVQEQQVVQNVYDAQYERSGAGVVTLVTKSGGHSFHGSGYDYFRNSTLDANTWSNDHSNPITPKGLFHRNQFGATFGGPLWRSQHLFFFGAYEGLRQPDSGQSGYMTVPTLAERAGDFSALCQTGFDANGVCNPAPPGSNLSAVQIYNPFSTHPAAGQNYPTRNPFPGNIIPSNLFDATGQKILNLYPKPNQPGDVQNFYAQGRGMTVNDKIDWRVDWEQSAKNRIFARMSDRIRQNDTPPCFLCNGADDNATNDDHGFQLVLNDTLTPSPSWVFDSYAAYGRWFEAQTALGYGKADASAIGLSPSLFQAPVLPVVNLDNYDHLGSTWSTYDRYVRSNVTFIENVTKEFSRHTLKFGANFDIAFMNNRQDSAATFNFGRGFTSCDPGPAAGAPCKAELGSDTSGNAAASLLLGTGNGTSPIQMDPAMSLHTYGAYIQDQWRVNQRLTITAGLRYENQRPATERFNRLTYFDTKAVNPISAAIGYNVYGAFEYANSHNRFAWDPDNRNFAPRLGIAYKVTDKLVARAGAGIFYGPASAMISFDSPGEFLGFNSTTTWLGNSDGAGYYPGNLVSNPFPNGLVQPVGSAQGGMTFVGVATNNVQQWPKGPHAIGYTEQWSLDLQYQLGSHSVLEAGYMGTRGRNLMYGNPNLNANQLPTQYLSLGDQLTQNVNNPFYEHITDPSSPLSQPQVPRNLLLRPFPEFVYLNWTRSLPGASSAYDALKLKYTHQFSNGLSVISSYTWSKALDNGSEDFIGWTIGNMWRDSYNTKLDYAVSTHDMPQSFATAFVYQLPYGKGKHWGQGAPMVLNQVLGNWEVSGLVRFSSGLPLVAPFYSYNQLGQFGFPGGGVPNIVGNPKPAHQTPDNWINMAAFAPPADFTYGNEPQRMSQLREAATKNADLAVAKYFGPERFRVRFGAEFLNAFNHPIYGGQWWGGWPSNIGICLDCNNTSNPFGKVIGTRNDPRNIQLSMKLMF